MNYDMTVLPGVYRLEWEHALRHELGEVSGMLPALLDRGQPDETLRISGQFPFAIVQYTNAILPRPFVLTSRRRARVSTTMADWIGEQSGLGRSGYLSLLSLLAITQLRTLALNSVLEAEDVLYTCHPACAFTHPATLDEYAQVLSHRMVCGGCKEFYSTLGAESELASVLRCLNS